jgi:hypothetical protein
MSKVMQEERVKMAKSFLDNRRSVSERRSRRERRCVFGDLTYSGVERRSYMDRRCGEERRKWFRLFLKVGCRPMYPAVNDKRKVEILR